MKKFDYSFKALGTICQISLVGEENSNFNAIVNKIYDIILNFENEFSRFNSNSSLSILNKSKSYDVSDNFLSLIYKSKEIYKLTDGYFNPLVNISNIGYSNSFDKNNFIIEKNIENLDFLNIKNYGNHIVLDDGMNLDFGSIAKGFLADIIGEYLQKNKFTNFLVNLGGDLKCSGVNYLGLNWKIGITNPTDKTKILFDIELKNKSISTSGIYLRNWEIDNKKYHHIKTPNTSKNNTEILSCSIIDNFGYKTDALATAVISMGLEKGLDFCKRNNLDFYIIDKDLKIYKK